MPSEFHQTLMNDLQAGLRGLEARSQRRTLTEISGINLCSNDYLGLSEHPALREAVAEAICGTARIGGTGRGCFLVTPRCGVRWRKSFRSLLARKPRFISEAGIPLTSA